MNLHKHHILTKLKLGLIVLLFCWLCPHLNGMNHSLKAVSDSTLSKKELRKKKREERKAKKKKEKKSEKAETKEIKREASFYKSYLEKLQEYPKDSLEETLYYAKAGLQMAVEDSSVYLTWFYHHLGRLHYALEQIPEAYENSELAFQTAPDLETRLLMVRQAAFHSSEYGKYPLAIEYYQEEFYIADTLEEHFLKNSPLCNMSRLYLEQENYPKAQKHATEAYDLFRFEPDRTEKGNSALLLGKVLLKQGKLDSARTFFDESLKLIRGKQQYFNENAIYTQLSNYHYIKEDFDLAVSYADSAMMYHNFHPLSVDAYIQTQIIVAKAQLAKENIEKAKEAVKKFEEKIDESKKLNVKMESYDFMMHFYQETEEYDKAMLYQEALENTGKEFATRYETTSIDLRKAKNLNEQKEALIKLLQQQNNNQELRLKNQELKLKQERYFKLLSLLLILLGATFIGFVIREYNKKRAHAQNLEEQVAIKTGQLQQTNEELQQTNEELKQFNYILSHDLKAPLRSIVSFTNLAENEIEGKAKVNQNGLSNLKEYFYYIKEGGWRLQKLINRVLEYQKIDKIKFEQEEIVDLNEVVQDIIHKQSLLIEHKNGLIKHNNLPQIKINREAIYIIFNVLIENGLKYNSSNEPLVEITCQPNGTFNHFYFKDNGIGIASQYQNQIFKMFRRLHTQEQIDGVGLGLSTIQKILNKIEGSIELTKSEEEKGSTFCLNLKQKLLTPVADTYT